MKLFGTDGIRGKAGSAPLVPETVARVGAALVRSTGIGENANAGVRGAGMRVVIGRDTRESGVWIEDELARGLSSEGATVVRAGVVPTPAIAYLARTDGFDAGIVISASHNPYEDNGIKVFGGAGTKLTAQLESSVETLVADSSWAVPGNPQTGLPPHDSAAQEHLAQHYVQHLLEIMKTAGPLAGSKIVIDCANGATAPLAPALFAQLGFIVDAIGVAPNGRNINLDCGSTHLDGLARAVVTGKARLGVAFDGDGDRALFVDHEGKVVDGDAILLMSAIYLKDRGRLPGPAVVATVMSNIGLEIALRDRGIEMVRTAVGDKYVMEEMVKRGFTLGGEQSGHVIFSDHLFTGDGLATALNVLRIMADTGEELSALASKLVTYPQVLVNVRVKQKTDLTQVPAIADTMRRVEEHLSGHGRLLVRYSGTEPLLRIMLEGKDGVEIKQWADQIANVVRENLSVIKLSVNVNKVATVRNSRGGSLPSVIEAVRTCIDAGAPGITVHPRADQRHITTADVHEIADELAPLKGRVEFNIEGDPRPGFLDLVLAVKPDQCTLVPVKPGEITSEAGWPADTPADALAGIVGALKANGVRVSLFVDPEPAAIQWARTMGADRVELYTEPFARAFERGPAAASASFAKYAAASNLAFDLGVGVNAGHDLDLKNLTLFKTLPHLDEVSIGHALISRAIFVGLGRVVKEYLAALSLVLLSIVLASPCAEAAGTRVSFPSGDGVVIAGEFYEAASRPAPAVLLVHMLSRSHADWGALPDRIRDAGITALAIDLRGHGQSSGSAQDLQAMVGDVRAAAQWLSTRPNVRGDQVAIVGASLGASLALLAAVNVPQVRAIALLSPSLDYRGLRTDNALIKRLGARSIWLAASDQDPLALRSLRDIAAEPSGPREQHVSSALAHGTVLLDKDGDVARSLVDWLRRSLLS